MWSFIFTSYFYLIFVTNLLLGDCVFKISLVTRCRPTNITDSKRFKLWWMRQRSKDLYLLWIYGYKTNFKGKPNCCEFGCDIWNQMLHLSYTFPVFPYVIFNITILDYFAGVTSVLTIATIIAGLKSALPKVCTCRLCKSLTEGNFFTSSFFYYELQFPLLRIMYRRLTLDIRHMHSNLGAALSPVVPFATGVSLLEMSVDLCLVLVFYWSQPPPGFLTLPPTTTQRCICLHCLLWSDIVLELFWVTHFRKQRRQRIRPM